MSQQRCCNWVSGILLALTLASAVPADAQALTTVTTVAPQSTIFSAPVQNVTLTATVTQGVFPVGCGAVTFQVKAGMTNVGGAVTDTTLAAGVATVSYTLPAATAPGTYTIEASYDGSGCDEESSIGTNTLTVDPLSDVGFSKAFLPDTIGPGSTTTLRFNIDNSASANTVTDLAFTDTLPAGVTIATPASASTDCTNGVLSAPDGGTTISLTDGGLGANSACSVTVNVTSSTVGAHLNVSGALTSSTGSSGAATATLTVDTARPAFSKSFTPSSIALGGRSTLTFTIDNSLNSQFLVNLAFTDNLPIGMEVADPANASTDCNVFSTGVVTAVPGTSVVSLGGASVAASSTCSATVDVIASGFGMLDNVTGELTFTIGFSSFSGGKATDTLDVTVTPLAIQKSFTDDPVPPGGTVTLDFTIDNFDRFDFATGIAFTDDLTTLVPALAGLNFDSLLSNNCGGSVSGVGGTTIGFSGGTLAPEASCTISTSLSVPGGTTPEIYTNTTGAITATVGGSPVTGNTASEDLFVEPAPLLTKTFMGDPVGAGDAIVLEFTVTNTSTTSSATNIAFQDLFDVVLPTASVTPGNDCCGVGSTCTFTPLINPPWGDPTIPATLTISGASLAPAGTAGDSCTFSITLDVLAGASTGTYPNTTTEITATVDGATRIGKPATDSFDIVAAPRLLKEFTDDPVNPGGTVALEFTLSHSEFAGGPATVITFTDDLAAVLAGLTATGLPKTDVCGTGNGTLTGSAGDTLLTFSGGTLAPGETCTFSVTLDVPANAPAGNHTNTTSSVVATVLGVTATGNAASDDLRIAGLVLTKEFIDDPVLPGDTVTLRFTLDNMHPTDNATEIVFTDNLDAALSGLTAEAPLPDTSTCDAGSSIVGTTFLVFSGGTVDAGTSCFFDVTVRVPAGAADGTYNNATSSVTATVGGLPIIGDPATDALTVDSDLLAFTKEFTDDPVPPGGTVTLEFALTNQATEAVSGIAFTDDLEATLAGLVATGLPIGACGGTVSTSDGGMTIDFSGGSLAAAGAAGDSCTFSVALSVPPDVLLGTTVTNTTSEVTGTLGGGEKLLATGGPAIDELRISSLDFSKAFDGPAPAGGTVVLTFNIVNLDASAGVSEIEFSDDLDLVVSGLEAIGLPVSDVCGPGSVFGGTSVLSLGGGSLGPGASCTFSVTLVVPMTAAARTYTNITGTLLVDSAPVGVPAVADLEIVSDAAIEITKTPAQPQVFAGDAVTFTIALRNLGSVDLTNLAVSDPLTPDCNRVAGDLPTLVPGSSTSYTCDTVPLFADLTNVATVTADIPNGTPVEASATGAVEVLDPAVTITKTPAMQQILAGETATFTITLTNVSDTDLINVMVSDPATPACDRSGGEGSPVLPNLASGQSVFYDCTTDPLGNDLVNVATVTAVTREGLPVNASASASVEVIVPIEIIKSPSEQTILPGATATFTITLDNPGTVAKTNVVVSDPLTPDCDTTLASLAAGATFAYTCTTSPLFADFTNIASVTAETPAGPVEASSTALVDVIDPAIEISKTPDVQLVLPGETASFTITVTNPGTDELTSIVVSDPLTPDCDFTIASLAAGASQSKVCTTGPLTDDFTNVATVTATSVAGEINASASALVNVRNPVEIIKAPAEQSVPFGGTATFTITLTNDSDTVLTDVAVSDSLAPDCDRAAGTLGDLQPMGGQFTYTCTTGALFVDLINQATVTAQGSEGTVTASDNALVDVLTDLQLTKTPADQQIEAGSAATFTITLTNGGTEVVTNIVVTDLLTPACDNAVASLNPGAIFSYDCTTEPLAFDLVNVATATGLVPGGVVSATATAKVEVFQPLVITKAPAEQEILAGETADFTITVSNPSQITRTDIAVSDPLTPSCDRAAGILGDLAPGASTTYTCTTGALFADLTNVATATGQGPAGTVTVSDTAFVLVLNSEISITKTPEAQLVSPGATASFTITLTNPGPAGLTDLSVTDPLTPACDRAVGTLPDLPAATSTSYTCQTGPLSTDFINLATVTATSDTGLPVTATASASVNVRNPIEILKAPFEQQVPEGASAAFVITLTNDGDTLKSNVAVSDPLSPDCARAAGTLPDLDPLGGSFSYSCQSGPVFTDFVNLATVTADSPSETVTASDGAAVFVLPPDYGDAPAPYPTLLANDGARHSVSEIPFYLGGAFDSEADGQPNADATGDDVNGIDDEDGVVFPPMALGLTATVDVTLTGVIGQLNAWIDFNADGDWNDAGEQIMADVPVVAGVNSFNYTVPIDAATGDTFARVRLDSGGGLLPTGLAADGEVEDYMVNIVFSFDTVPPTVTLINSVFDTGDGTVEECETAQVEISKLLVTFSEPVQDPPGDTDPDDVTNPANYLVVAAGPDADLDTTACGTVFGDDVQVPVGVVSYDDGGPTATLDLGLLPSSLIRLMVCGSTSIHDLAGNPLDGNGNGTGGDDFVLTFRSDPTNLFANGHFDCDTDGWVLSSATPGEIVHSAADSDASSLSGSLEFMQLGVNTVYSAEQCVQVSPGAETLLIGLVQVTIPTDMELSLTSQCASYASTDCSGAPLGITATTAVFDDSGGLWEPVASTVPEEPGRMSALCGFTVRVPGGDDFTLRLDKLFFGAGTLIFKDGFESGNTSAWSLEVGGSP